MKANFNTKRFWMLSVREFTLSKKNFLIIFPSMLIVTLLISLLTPREISVEHGEFVKFYKQYTVYPIGVLIYCLAITSFSFLEFNSYERKIEYLLLPATKLEKLLAKLFLTTVGYSLLAFFALQINLWLVNWLNVGLPYNSIATNGYYISKEEINYLLYIYIYLILQPVFFFCSIYFTKLELPKTIIALSLIGGALFILLKNGSLIGLENINRYTVLNERVNSAQFDISTESKIKLIDIIVYLSNILFYTAIVVIPLLFWFLSYLRLKEAEVKDGI